MTLEGRTRKIKKHMQKEGRLVDLSKRPSNRMDHKIAVEFAPIKKESRQKEKASRAYIADLKSGRLNFYQQTNFYQKVKDCFFKCFSK